MSFLLRQIAIIGAHQPPFTIFVSQDDKALALSRRVWGNEARLGAVNPRVQPFKGYFEKARANVYDLTELRGQGAINHDKFATNSQIVTLIGRRLIAGQTLSDSEPGLGERTVWRRGAAKTVGGAAGLAASVPLAIVDGRTRDSLGSQVGELGGNVRDTIGSVGAVVPGQ